MSKTANLNSSVNQAAYEIMTPPWDLDDSPVDQ